MTVVPTADGAAPLSPSSQVKSGSASFPLPLLCSPQQHLAGDSSVARLAQAVEASGTVKAAAAIQAGLAGAVIQVDGAEASAEASWAEA